MDACIHARQRGLVSRGVEVRERAWAPAAIVVGVVGEGQIFPELLLQNPCSRAGLDRVARWVLREIGCGEQWRNPVAIDKKLNF